MTELNLQKAAAAKGQLGPSSLLAFWKTPCHQLHHLHVAPREKTSLLVFLHATVHSIHTNPFMQYAALGCIPPPLSTQINTLAYYHKICRQIQCPRGHVRERVISCPCPPPFLMVAPHSHAEWVRWSHVQSAIRNSDGLANSL